MAEAWSLWKQLQEEKTLKPNHSIPTKAPSNTSTSHSPGRTDLRQCHPPQTAEHIFAWMPGNATIKLGLSLSVFLPASLSPSLSPSPPLPLSPSLPLSLSPSLPLSLSPSLPLSLSPSLPLSLSPSLPLSLSPSLPRSPSPSPSLSLCLSLFFFFVRAQGACEASWPHWQEEN